MSERYSTVFVYIIGEFFDVMNDHLNSPNIFWAAEIEQSVKLVSADWKVRVRNPMKENYFPFSTPSTQALGPKLFAVQWVAGHSLGVKEATS